MKYLYTPPDFAAVERDLRERHELHDAAFLAAPADGIAPERFYTSTKYPTYIRLGGNWQLARCQRIDCAIIFDQASGSLICVEPQRIHCGDPVLVGQAPMDGHEEAWRKSISENGEEGIYVHTTGFEPHRPAEIEHEPENATAGESASEATIDYDALAELVEEHHATAAGSAIWVLGPTIAHPRGRCAMHWLIAHGYVGAVFGGNEMALQDIEKAMLGVPPDRRTPAGWRMRLAVRNKLRQFGTLGAAIEAGVIQNGILYACHMHNIPVVLAGSIRDDSPLPEVITDVIAAQQAMQKFAAHATLALMIGSVLHEIATERMLPLYVERDGTIAPVDIVAVHGSPFSLAKLTQHSAHRVSGIVCGAEDFLGNLVATLKSRRPDRQRHKTLDLPDSMLAPTTRAAL